MTLERVDPPLQAGEREMLNSWLEAHRATLAWKCDGLTGEQLRQRSVPPSTLSLLGLVRHMAEVERGWFRRTLAGEDTPPIYFSQDDNPDGDFDDVDDADVAGDFATWRAGVAALDSGAHGRGVCPPQRARRPAPRANRRRHRGLTR